MPPYQPFNRSMNLCVQWGQSSASITTHVGLILSWVMAILSSIHISLNDFNVQQTRWVFRVENSENKFLRENFKTTRIRREAQRSAVWDHSLYMHSTLNILSQMCSLLMREENAKSVESKATYIISVIDVLCKYLPCYLGCFNYFSSKRKSLFE